MSKKLVSVRLPRSMIDFIEKLNGENFSMKLCQLIGDYDFEELSKKRKEEEARIRNLKKRYIELKDKLIKSTSKIEELIRIIKWE